MKRSRSVASFFVLFFAFFIADCCSKWITDATELSDFAERVIDSAINVVIVYIASLVFAKLWPKKAKEAKAEEAQRYRRLRPHGKAGLTLSSVCPL